MSRYHVHVYPVFRVLVLDIEAESQEDACRQADQATTFERFNQANLEYADEVSGFLVDEDGDTEHERSAWYDAEYRPQ
jgi:hypothetical protein